MVKFNPIHLNMHRQGLVGDESVIHHASAAAAAVACRIAMCVYVRACVRACAHACLYVCVCVAAVQICLGDARKR